MYALCLTDGTRIENLKRLNPSTFELNSNDPNIYHQLNDFNLSLATLEKDGELEDIFIDYTRQNYISQGNIIQFRLCSLEERDKRRKKKK